MVKAKKRVKKAAKKKTATVRPAKTRAKTPEKRVKAKRGGKVARIQRTGTHPVLGFVHAFAGMLEQQLAACRSELSDTVDGILRDVKDISRRTAANKDHANTVLLQTYTAPDVEARKAMDDVQDEVSRLFDAAQAEMSGGGSGGGFKAVVVPKDNTPNGEDGSMRRSVGLFSKHMEALETLDGQLEGSLMSMMQRLASDDELSQRLDHVVSALQALQAGLGRILEGGASAVERCEDDLKSYVFRTFTTDQERKLFYDAFPEERKAS